MDASAQADGGQRDAAGQGDAMPMNDAAPTSDAGQDDALPAPDVPTAPDAGPGDALPGDATVSGDAGPVPCDGPLSFEGLAEGRIYAMQPVPLRLLPVSAAPVDVTPILETGSFVASVVARVGSAGVSWHAQVSQLTQFSAVNVEHSVRDPADGALYVGIEQQIQNDGTAIRFYHGDGTLAAEFTLGGPAGHDLIGGPRQSNLFVAKIDATGHVAWVSRFGPNRSTNTSGFFSALGLTPRGVRVMGSVEGATDIVFAPGTTSAHTLTLRTSGAYWAELDKTDGNYVAGSAGGVIAQDNQGSVLMFAFGEDASSPAGETAFAGTLTRGGGQEVYRFGETAPLSITATTGYTFIGKIAPDATVPYVGRIEAVGLRIGPEARAVAISPNGDVVAGGQFSVSGAQAVFTSSASAVQLNYQPQNSYLAAYAPDGTIRWVKLIASTNRNAISRLVVSADAVYLSGSSSMGDTIGAGAPNSLSLPATGYFLAKLDLTSGQPLWIRAFHEGASGVGTTRHSLVGNRLLWPASLQSLTVTGDGPDTRYVGLRAGVPMLGAVVLDTDGHVQGCQAVGEYAAGFRAFP